MLHPSCSLFSSSSAAKLSTNLGWPPGCPAINCVFWCMGQKRLTTGLTPTSSFLSSRAWMKQLRIRIFDVMTDWRVFLLCPMGFQWGNLLSSTVILHKRLWIHLGWELEDFQEEVQGGSGTVWLLRELEAKYVKSLKMEAGEFTKEVLLFRI